VLHMSAQFMHMDTHLPMSLDIIAPSAHMVHACSQAAQASIISFIAIMSMPGMVIMVSIILMVIFITKRKSIPVITMLLWAAFLRERLCDEILR